MPQDLVNNNESFKKDWEPNISFIKQIKQAIEFATDGTQPYWPDSEQWLHPHIQQWHVF